MNGKRLFAASYGHFSIDILNSSIPVILTAVAASYLDYWTTLATGDPLWDGIGKLEKKLTSIAMQVVYRVFVYALVMTLWFVVLVVWSGDPLQVTSNAEAVYIDGVAQPRDSRQTRLRDRYRDLGRGVLPEAYRR